MESASVLQLSQFEADKDKVLWTVATLLQHLCMATAVKDCQSKCRARRKLSFSALSRIVLYCKLLYDVVCLITRFSGRQGQSTESHRTPHEV